MTPESPFSAQPESVEGPSLGGHDVTTTLNYYREPGDGSAPTPVVASPEKVTNVRPAAEVPVTIQDISGRESLYTLDSHGFQIHRHGSCEKLFLDENTIKAVYFTETEQMLKDVTGASWVKIFDHKVRRGPSHWHQLGENNTLSRGPLHRVHVDQSYDGAEIVLQRWFPDEANEVKAKRWQIINVGRMISLGFLLEARWPRPWGDKLMLQQVWRPLKTVHQSPLAVADARSVSDDDLVAAEVHYAPSGHRAETWAVTPSSSHHWYYKYAQRPNEVMLIKCFDSDTANAARRTPHSAFEDPAYPEDDGANKGGRESIEVRALVMY
ncbi:hypothetical protein PG993_002439 [Apiospora rasikravindrae]|uniref:Methyltransferase n=1 Tax=Apiospora rasikravindrae TaxID=990691 RepID=A0ABR1TWM7_9PEZI